METETESLTKFRSPNQGDGTACLKYLANQKNRIMFTAPPTKRPRLNQRIRVQPGRTWEADRLLVEYTVNGQNQEKTSNQAAPIILLGLKLANQDPGSPMKGWFQKRPAIPSVRWILPVWTPVVPRVLLYQPQTECL